MAMTEAKLRALKKYDQAHYDVGSVKLPKGTRERIAATGNSWNGFINRAVLAALEEYEHTRERGGDPEARE